MRLTFTPNKAFSILVEAMTFKKIETFTIEKDATTHINDSSITIKESISIMDEKKIVL
jgi:hypothetical protein